MINRIPEKQAIKNIYGEFYKTSAMLILYAKTGVGKTLLTDTVFTNLPDTCYIRAKITQQQAEETNGFYLSCLAKSLNEYAHRTSFFSTIEDFAENIYRLDKNTDKIIDDLLDIGFAYFDRKDLRDKLKETKTIKENIIIKVLESDTEIAVSFMLEYIAYISKIQKIVVSIENIQNANEKFISFLNELIKKTNNLFFVGEYTIVASETEVTNLFRQFPFDRTSVYEIKKLDKLELLGGLSQIVSADRLDLV